MALLTPLTLIVSVIFVCVVIYKYLIYPALLSPLAKIPNAHWSAPISPAWILWQRHQFKENGAINAAHDRLGPVVRLGPNDLSVNCVADGIRTIYGNGFEKPDWYDLFTNYNGIHTMFTTGSSKIHSTRKRIMSHAYSKSYIQTSATMAIASRTVVVDRVLPQLNQIASSKSPMDMYFTLNCILMDLVTAYMFGLQSSSNFVQNTEEAHWWLSLYQSRKKFTFWPQELPRFTSFMARFGIHLSPTWVAAANHDLETWCLQMCDAAEAVVSSRDASTLPSDDAANDPVIYSRLTKALALPAKTTPTPVEYQRLQRASEMLDQLSAGHETSSITLTFLFHELSQRPALQDQLRAELLTLSPPMPTPSTDSKSAELPSPKTIDALPLLHAILMETLRRHAAIPGPQPRKTPPNATLGPYSNIPADVRVSAQAYSLHRNPHVFPEPETWRPERWLVGEGKDLIDEGEVKKDVERRAEMARWFWAFGSGGRMCIGSNLAMLAMKLVIATIYTSFRTTIVDDTNIEQEDSYTAQPRAKKLLLRLERV